MLALRGTWEKVGDEAGDCFLKLRNGMHHEERLLKVPRYLRHTPSAIGPTLFIDKPKFCPKIFDESFCRKPRHRLNSPNPARHRPPTQW